MMESQHVHGYTLIELMVTLSVVAILLGVAAPNFASFLASARSSADVQTLTRSLMNARSEAVARGETVRVTAVGGSWDRGWRTWIDSNGNDNFDAGELIRQASGLEGGAELTSARGGSVVTSIAFDAEGFSSPAEVVAFTYRTQKPAKCSRDRDVRLSATGQVTVTERACS